MTGGDIQTVMEQAAKQAAIKAVAEMDLAGRAQLLVSGMEGVSRVLDMSRSKVHRIRAAATREGIPFPEPALYSGLGGSKSYWLRDIEDWIRRVGEAGIGW